MSVRDSLLASTARALDAPSRPITPFRPVQATSRYTPPARPSLFSSTSSRRQGSYLQRAEKRTPKPNKSDSLWEQIAKQPQNFATGMFDVLVRAPVGTGIGAAQMAADALGDGLKDGGVGETYFKDANAVASGLWQNTQAISKYAPYVNLGTGLSTSMGQRDAAQAATRLKTASDEGRIVDTVLGDIGTAAMATGVTGGVLGRAGLKIKSPQVGLKANRAARSSIRPTSKQRITTPGGKVPANKVSISSTRAQPLSKVSINRAGSNVNIPIRPIRTQGGAALPDGTMVMQSNRGLAGVAQRMGKPNAARKLTDVGDEFRNLGYQSDWTEPVIGGYRAAKGGVRRLRRQQDPSKLEQLLNSKEAARTVRSELLDARTAQERYAIFANNLAGKLDLPERLQRVVLQDVSSAHTQQIENARQILAQHGEAGHARIEADLLRYNDGIPDGTTRLTLDDILAWDDALTGKITPDELSAMGNVRDALVDTVSVRTSQMLGTGRLDPEQVGSQELTQVRDRITRQLEDEIARAEEGVAELGTRAEDARRQADNLAAFVDQELQRAAPGQDPSSVESVWAERLQERRETARAEVLEARLTEKVTELETKLEQLQARIRNRPEAETRLADLDAEAADLYQGIKELQAEIKVIDDMRLGPEAHAYKQGVPEQSAVRDMVVTVRDELVRDLADDRTRIGGSYADGPTVLTRAQLETARKSGAVNPEKGKISGSYDHWIYRPDKELTAPQKRLRNQLVKRGYLGQRLKGTPAEGRHVTAPDVFAQAVRENHPLWSGLTDTQILERWIDMGRREIELADARNVDDAIVEVVSSRLEIDSDMVVAGLGNRKEWATATADAIEARRAQDPRTSLTAAAEAGMDNWDYFDEVDAYEATLGEIMAETKAVRRRVMRQRLKNDAYRVQRDRPKAADLAAQVENIDARATEARSLADAATTARQEAHSIPPGQWDSGATVKNLQDMGRLEAEAVRHEADLRAAKFKVSTAQRRLADLDQTLSTSRQDRIGAAWHHTLRGMQHTVNRITQGRELGSRDANHLTGLLGELAEKYNIYDKVMKEVQKQAYQVRRLSSANEILDTNVTVNAFYRVLEDELVTISPDDIRALDVALLADDLVETMHQLNDRMVEGAYGPTAGSKVVFDEVMARIDEIERMAVEEKAAGTRRDVDARTTGAKPTPGEVAYKLPEDLKVELIAQYSEFETQRARLLLEQTDHQMAVMPAAYRRVAKNTVRAIRASYEAFDDAWSKAKDATKAGDKVEFETQRALAQMYAQFIEDAPTTLKAMVDRQVEPIHVIGGAGVSGRSIANALAQKSSQKVEVGSVRGEHKMATGQVESDLSAYTRLESQQLADLATSEVVKRMAQDPAFSERVDVILEQKVNDTSPDPRRQQTTLSEWNAQNTEVMPFGEMQRQLALRGFTLIGNTADMTRNNRVDSAPNRVYLDTVDEITGARRFDDGQGVVRTQDWEVFPADVPRPAIEGMQLDTTGLRAIPTKLAEELLDMTNPKSSKYGLMWDQGTQMWKTAVLPLSPQWLTNNILGNFVMSVMGGGVSPLRLVQEIADALDLEADAYNAHLTDGKPVGKFGVAKELWRQGGTFNMSPSRLSSHGLTYNEWRGSNYIANPETKMGRALAAGTDPEYNRLRADTLGKRRPVRSFLSRTVQGSYALNEFTDNMFRTAVFNAKLERNMPDAPAHLFNSDGTPKPNADPAEMARLRKDADKAYEQSLKGTLSTLGDFTRLTRWERNTVKRALPFYPWLRHQIGMSMRLPVYHPLRAATLAAIHTAITDDEDEGWWYQNMFGMSFDTPAGNIDLSSANPYMNPFDLLQGSEQTTQMINPLITQPVSFFTGIDLSQNESFSRPSDQKTTGLFGSKQTTSTFERLMQGRDLPGALGEVAYQALGQSKISSNLRDMALTQVPGSGYLGVGKRPLGASTYDSGDVSPYPAKDVGLWQAAGGLANLPFVPRDRKEQLMNARIRDAMRSAGER